MPVGTLAEPVMATVRRRHDMTVIGYVLLALAILWFAFKVYVSFETEGGVVGMTPVLDGALFPSTTAVFGVRLIVYPLFVGGQRQHLSGSNLLVLGLIWCGSIAVAGLLIIWVGKLGERAHRRRREGHQ